MSWVNSVHRQFLPHGPSVPRAHVGPSVSLFPHHLRSRRSHGSLRPLRGECKERSVTWGETGNRRWQRHEGTVKRMHDRDLVGSSFLCLRSRLHSFLSGSWFVPHLTIPHYSLHSWPKAGAAPYSRVPRNERSKRQGIGWKKPPQGETNDERSEWKTDTRFVCSSLVLGSPRSFVPRCPSVVYDPGPEGNREGPGERHGGGNEGNMRPPLTCLSASPRHLRVSFPRRVRSSLTRYTPASSPRPSVPRPLRGWW